MLNLLLQISVTTAFIYYKNRVLDTLCSKVKSAKIKHVLSTKLM